MSRTLPALRLPLLILLLAVVTTATVFATSYVLPTDARLVDDATLIVVGTVEAVDTAPGEAATHSRLRVSETLKGALAIGDRVTVRVPGGTDPSGKTWLVYGAPQFEVGEELLLFLDPRPDGSYGIHQLMLGAFHGRDLGSDRVGVRNLSGASRVGEVQGARTGPRDLDAFKAWIADRVAGTEREADYFAAPAEGIQSQPEPFRFIRNNPAIRYFEFDSGGSVPWRLNSNGSGISAGTVNAARNAWNNENQTPINYTYSGTTGADDGLADFDGLNVVLGGDPNNEADGTFSCPGGGVLAVGGPWFDLGVTDFFKGEEWLVSFGGDVVFNNGVQCYFAGSQGETRAREVLTHEFGHTLGLGHSCGDSASGPCNTSAKEDATMNAFVHDDGRGASIRSDDRNGVRALYAPAGGGGGTPNAPSGLIAVAVSPTQALVSFLDNSINETGFRVEARPLGGSFVTLADGPDNMSELVVGGLTPGLTYNFRVRALGGNNSGPSNEATTTQPLIVGGCTESDGVLCLQDDRFHVSASFISRVDSGIGQAVELTPDTGYFWFFDDDNVELVTKVLRACGLPGFDNFWVFSGGLTNVQVTLTVVDTENNQVRAYSNPLDLSYAPINDTNAFETCP